MVKFSFVALESAVINIVSLTLYDHEVWTYLQVILKSYCTLFFFNLYGMTLWNCGFIILLIFIHMFLKVYHEQQRREGSEFVSE